MRAFFHEGGPNFQRTAFYHHPQVASKLATLPWVSKLKDAGISNRGAVCFIARGGKVVNLSALSEEHLGWPLKGYLHRQLRVVKLLKPIVMGDILSEGE